MTKKQFQKILARALSVGFLMIALLCQNPQTQASDVSNIKKEENLSQIYKTYHSEPTDEKMWSLIAGQSGYRSYRIQKGESLWEISEMLFGDGFFWPKVWALNKDITNPHDINPGMELAFTPGTISDAPSLSFAQSSIFLTSNQEQGSNEVAPEVLAHTINVEIPPPLKESNPLLPQIPQSLPGWQFKQPTQAMVKLDLNRPPRNEALGVQKLPYFVSEGSISTEGEVVGTELSSSVASINQKIFVRIDGNIQGNEYLVIKDLGKMKSKFLSVSDVNLIEVQGVLQIGEAVDAESKIYRATVKHNIHSIEIGAKVMPSGYHTYDTSAAGEIAQVGAYIFGGQFENNRDLFSREGIVFLDKGAKAGISPNQVLGIYKNQSLRTDKDLVRQNPLRIGKLKVIRVNENTSTAVVLESTQEIVPGDGTSPEVVVAK